MTDIRKPLIAYFIGYLTFSLAHYPSVPLHRTPFHPSIIHHNPYFNGRIYFRRPVFNNMNPRFHPGLRFPPIPRINTMINTQPRHQSHGGCASEQHSVRPSIPTEVADTSSYDRKDPQTLPVQRSEFESVNPTVEAHSINVWHNVASVPGSESFKAPDVQQGENNEGNNPTFNSETGQIFGVKPTLRLENTTRSNETSSDPRNPDWNYFDFITNKDFIIKLIENKLIKLQNQEKIVGGISVNTQLYDQIKKIEDAMGITVPLDNATAPTPPVQPSSTGENREGQYTALSTFMANFFCAWCRSHNDRQRSTCLKFCFNDIIRQNGRSEDSDSPSK